MGSRRKVMQMKKLFLLCLFLCAYVGAISGCFVCMLGSQGVDSDKNSPMKMMMSNVRHVPVFLSLAKRNDKKSFEYQFSNATRKI
jgi:hypothetical protein